MNNKIKEKSEELGKSIVLEASKELMALIRLRQGPVPHDAIDRYVCGKLVANGYAHLAHDYIFLSAFGVKTLIDLGYLPIREKDGLLCQILKRT